MLGEAANEDQISSDSSVEVTYDSREGSMRTDGGGTEDSRLSGPTDSEREDYLPYDWETDSAYKERWEKRDRDVVEPEEVHKERYMAMKRARLTEQHNQNAVAALVSQISKDSEDGGVGEPEIGLDAEVSNEDEGEVEKMNGGGDDDVPEPVDICEVMMEEDGAGGGQEAAEAEAVDGNGDE